VLAKEEIEGITQREKNTNEINPFLAASLPYLHHSHSNSMQLLVFRPFTLGDNNAHANSAYC